MAAEPAFLTYYLNEIDKLRTAGSELARTHKHVAGNLDFRGAQTADPQVARLIESFAFLTARLQQQFDDEFPQIPTALLAQLYPQLVAPIPSMAIASFQVSPKQDRSIEGLVVPRESAIFATTESGAECRFRTGFDLPLWPIEVSQVSMPAPDTVRWLDNRSDVEACIRLRLSCMGPTRTFAEFAPRSLQFYVDGDRNGRFRLFELLCNNLIEIAIVETGDHGETIVSPPGLRIRPMGLEPDQAMLPYPEAAHHGYRLLQEYFNFPDKFMFVELSGLGPRTLGEGRHVDLVFLLDTEPVEPIRVDAQTLRLGCVPIINLFPQTSEPIRLDHFSVDYPLEPDIRAAGTTEIHTILSVSRSQAGTDKADMISPYFGGVPNPESGPLRWIARRQGASNPALSGTEMQLSFVDPEMNPLAPPGEDVLFAQTLCTNRMLARQIPAGTRFQIESDLPIERIQCLVRPSQPADPPMAGENLWRLVSHLSLNKLSLDDGARSLDALKQILFLYSGSDENSRKRRQIDGIASLKTRPVVRRLGDRRWRGFVRGIEISLRFREESFIGGSAYLFGAVLDRFFALYAGVNSFTEVVIARERDDEDWIRWPARAGDRPLL
jgi:type VI secretion system protein ImpG